MVALPSMSPKSRTTQVLVEVARTVVPPAAWMPVTGAMPKAASCEVNRPISSSRVRAKLSSSLPRASSEPANAYSTDSPPRLTG